MKRMQLFLTEPQIAQLAKLSKARGLSKAELIRRAIDAYAELWKVERKAS